jgi:hypothetical protein
MGFASGSVSFRRFAVIGDAPTAADQTLLDKLADHALKVGEFGVPEEEEYGWSGGRHVLDGNFSFEHNVYADALHFALRIDTNKVPSDLKKAYQLMEEEAVAANNPSGFISKGQKRDVKDTVRRKVDDELRSGKFRRSKLLPILWDLPGQTLYCNASGKSFEKLAELFERSFGLSLMPISAGSLSLRLLEPKGRRRDYEDLRPTRFVFGPEGESQHPEYPWVAKGPEPKDFVGNEMLLWLWHEADVHSGTIKTDAGDVTVFIDKTLDLDCAYGQTGRDGLKGDGPARMPEARDGLRSGKVPRRAGLMLEAAGMAFSLNFNPEAIAVGGAKLPEVEEAENPRVLFEERIAMLRELSKGLDGLYDAFLKTRVTSAWEGHVSTIRKWITSSQRKASEALVAVG